MSDQQVNRSRLIMQIEALMREINTEVINPEIPEIALKDLDPIIKMVAKTRVSYLKELFAVSKAADGNMPSPEDLRHLASLRLVYEELTSGAQALETAIERGYLDVKS